MEFSLLAIVVGIILAGIELLFGVAIGWWLHANSEPASSGSEEEAQRARLALERLHELATTVAADVGEHSTRVQEISRELNRKQPEAGELDTAVLSTVAKIVEANSRLQKQLASAEDRLQQQARQIQVHAADALTDSLTGAANRRAFDQQIAQRISEWNRWGTPMSLMMIDVDHFKKFNDTHGHLAGDNVLRGVAETLRRTFRDVDLVARYGGEEFAVIFPNTDLGTAQSAAERARVAIEEARFEVEGKALSITASQGLAQVLPGDDIASVVKRADAALYASKHSGRNCVHAHDGVAVFRVGEEKSEHSEPAAEESKDEEPAREVTIDPQTGLLNRTAFFEEVRYRVTESQRFDLPLSLLVIKLDRFDRIAAEHGQSACELTLRTVTQFLSAALRDMDIVARYEPDTFAVLMPSVPLDHAAGIGEKLRSTIASCPLRVKNQSLAFSISVGVVEGLAEDDSASLVKRAGAAVNAAVEAGCNGTYLHDGQACQAYEPPVAVLR